MRQSHRIHTPSNLYAALLQADVNVVVLRPVRAKLNIENQMRMIAASINRVEVLLSGATEPILIKVDASGTCTVRDLGALVSEIDGQEP